MKTLTGRAARILGIAAAAVGVASLVGGVEAACNGHDEYCSRRYSNVSIIGAHDSFAVRPGSLAANQNYTVDVQLENGIRLLQGQGHNSNGVIHLCHSSCSLLDTGTLEDYLRKVKSFLDSNPDEVVTLLWVNSDNLPISQWASVYASTGMDKYSYAPATTPLAYDAWPTYQELISSGKRAVTFIDNGADVSAASYFIDEFTHVWETPYNATTQDFPCVVDRITGATAGKMYLINHMLHTPLNINLGGGNSDAYIIDTARLGQTNAASGTGSLGLQAQQCASQWGYYPTFMLVDYYDVGNGSVFQVAAEANGVQYTPVQVGNGTTSGGSGTGSGSGSGSGSSSGSGSTGSASTLSRSALGMASALFAVGAWIVVA